MAVAYVLACFTFVKYLSIIIDSKSLAMTTRFLIGIGLAFALVFIGGICAVVSINSVTNRVAVTDETVPDKAAPAPVTVSDAPVSLPKPSEAPPQTPLAAAPVVPVTVLDSDLANLAAAVKLGATSTSTGDVSKDVLGSGGSYCAKIADGPVRLRPAQLAETFCPNGPGSHFGLGALSGIGQVTGDASPG